MARDDPRPTAAELAGWENDRRERYELGRLIDENPTRDGWDIDGRTQTQAEWYCHQCYTFFADRYRTGASGFIEAHQFLLERMEHKYHAIPRKGANTNREYQAG